jgi:alpha-L-fucosidase
LQKHMDKKNTHRKKHSFQNMKTLMFKSIGVGKCVWLGIALLPLVMFAPALKATPTNNFYHPTWASVDQHTPSPEWFQDAKFGIYFHWGIFSVPAHYSEWYGHWCYYKSDTTGCYAYQTNTFGYPAISGPPYPLFPYDLFITGGTNKAGQRVQFAPQLVSNGGSFDPNAWAAVFVDAGAQFAGPMAEHHDGFSMWASKVNPWNALSNGPKQDLVGELVTAIRAKNLKIVLSFHHAYNFQGFWQYAPAQSSTIMKQMYGQLPFGQECTLWEQKLEECIDAYQPDIIWQDFDLSGITLSNRLNFLAYYYNSGLDWNKQVVATYKNSDFDTNGEVLDYERGGPADVLDPYWLTDESVSGFTWGYTSGMSLYSAPELIDEMIDRVAKGGNFLLSCAPMANGVIPTAQTNLLHGIGVWLKQNGEAIYSTRAWTTGGEGPTVLGGPSFNGPKVGTSADIRFTRNKATNVLYAIFMGWPGNGAQEKIITLSSTNINLTTLTNVQLFGVTAGTYINLAYTQNTSGLNVTMPGSQPYTATAYALKLSFSGLLPQLGHTAPPPPTPTGLAATPGNNQVALTWNTSSGATSYNVKRSTTSGSGYATIASPTTTSYTDTTAANGTTYYYVVSAVNTGGESANSSQVSATPSGGGGSGFTSPIVLVNPGFETNTSGVVFTSKVSTGFDVSGNDVAGWLNAGSTYASSGVDYAGDSGVVVHGGSVTAYCDQGDSGAYQITGYPMQAGDQLTLTWWAKSSYNNAAQSVSLLSGASPGSAFSSLTTLATSTAALNNTGNGGAYTQYTLTYTAGAADAGKYVAVSFLAPGTAGSWAMFDDFALSVTSLLPSPWASGDIGAVGVAGSATYTNGLFTVKGSGADIWGTGDTFNYAYQPASGDCSIQAEVLSVQNTQSHAKGGVMIRETLNTNSAMAMVDLTPSAGVEFVWRTNTAASAASVGVAGITAPNWVKVTRTGNSFVGYYSTNGTAWTVLGTNTITMGTGVYVGLPVCAHNNTVTCTATFTNVVAAP